MPDLRNSVKPTDSIRAAREALPDAPINLVGHSGAGALLPAIGEGRLDRLVFVDALLSSSDEYDGNSRRR